MNNKAFTLLELIVVIIIIGILATLGITQYTRIIERGRSAEARSILGTIRRLQVAYRLEKGTWANSLTDLGLDLPVTCASTHYFSYLASGTDSAPPKCGGQPLCAARRCTAGAGGIYQGGKSPDATSPYVLRLCFDSGNWDNDAGY